MTIYRVPVEISYPQSGGPGVNVWHVRTASGWATSPLYLQDAVDAIRTFYESLGTAVESTVGLYAPGTVVSLGEVVDIESSESASPTFSPISYGGVGGQAPPALQIVISWRTSVAARRGRGRTFLGPLNSAAVDVDGTPTAQTVGTLGTIAQTLVTTSQAGNSWAVGVYGQQSLMSGSTVTPKMRQDAPHVLRDITGFRIKDQFAVLRSRRD